MARSAAPRKAALRLAVSEDAYSLSVDNPDEALCLVEDFFGRVGEIKKRGARSVKALLQHPDGYECVAKAKIYGSRLHLSKRAGDPLVFSLTFRLVREALRLDGLPPVFFHGQIYRRAERPPPPPDAAEMSDLELPPTRASGFYEWPKERILDFAERHRDVLEEMGRGDMDVRSFVAHVETIPRSLLDSRCIAPSAFNVPETCEKIYELLREATAFWA